MLNFITNSMSVESDNLSEHFTNLQSSGLEKQNGWGSAPGISMKGQDGAIFTEFYNEFQHLPNDKNHDIFDKRKQLKTPSKIISNRINESAYNSDET